MIVAQDNQAGDGNVDRALGSSLLRIRERASEDYF
jgi:hypothetical protein